VTGLTRSGTSARLRVGYDGNGVSHRKVHRADRRGRLDRRARFGRGDVDVLGDTSLLAVGTPTAGNLRVGVQGIGTLHIATGADAYSFGGTVGDRPFLDDFGDPIENGTVTITGAGSLWDVREILWVGRNGKGAIDVRWTTSARR
jgi:T5SS/PEP-CTERM-associated repeat protein